jgi:hypothetical protein
LNKSKVWKLGGIIWKWKKESCPLCMGNKDVKPYTANHPEKKNSISE